ncbi:Golgi membrane protein 1 [Dendropsophus ebraccatus]|uniref:Golgi membrane protein 1 n=1 Tax=Dendropsophus ebraccatus TaxID=150705 RepID=UPI0038311A44
MGLGSGRRAMKSPPLLIAVLLACVFVLGINYWITSTRCVELQSRVMELEGRIRRAAAERGAVEMKKNEFEDMLAKQKNQIETIQTLHSSQMQNAQQSCKSEKETLQNNVQILQAEIADNQKKLEDFQLEFNEMRDSQAKKLSFELAQCSNKIAEVKEQCEESIRRLTAKDGNTAIEEDGNETILTKFKKIKVEFSPVTSKQEITQKAIDVKEQKSKVLVPTVESSKKEGTPLPLNKEQTKKLNVAVDEKKPSPSPQPKKHLAKDEKEEEPPSDVNPNLPNADEDDDEPKLEDAEDPNKEAENYEVERENLINLDGQAEDEKVTKITKQAKEKLNDYNGDEANEAESETEKQEELGADDKRPKGAKTGNALKKFGAKQPAEDGDDLRLK